MSRPQPMIFQPPLLRAHSIRYTVNTIACPQHFTRKPQKTFPHKSQTFLPCKQLIWWRWSLFDQMIIDQVNTMLLHRDHWPLIFSMICRAGTSLGFGEHPPDQAEDEGVWRRRGRRPLAPVLTLAATRGRRGGQGPAAPIITHYYALHWGNTGTKLGSHSQSPSQKTLCVCACGCVCQAGGHKKPFTAKNHSFWEMLQYCFCQF